jgi:hypothetical protein
LITVVPNSRRTTRGADQALRVTAAGQWGLFGHNADRISRNAATPFVDNLLETGKAIDQMREQLAMSPFDLHQEFLASRGPVKPDAVGEQAGASLARPARRGQASVTATPDRTALKAASLHARLVRGQKTPLSDCHHA